jgi:hypothetical protein
MRENLLLPYEGMDPSVLPTDLADQGWTLLDAHRMRVRGFPVDTWTYHLVYTRPAMYLPLSTEWAIHADGASLADAMQAGLTTLRRAI